MPLDAKSNLIKYIRVIKNNTNNTEYVRIVYNKESPFVNKKFENACKSL